MNVKMTRVSDLRPYENNPRKNEEAVAAVAASIRDFGFLVPIVERGGLIVAGHTRYEAALRLGLQHVPTISAEDLTEEQANAFRLADNKTSEFSEWDFEILRSEAAKLREEFSDLFDLSEYGFEPQELYEVGMSDAEFASESPSFLTLSFSLREEQADFIKDCIKMLDGEFEETFGNKNKNGNAIYTVVKQWADARI